MLSLLIIIAASLLAAAPLTASAQNSQWGGSWRNNVIIDDASTSNNTNTNYQGIPDQATALTNGGANSTPTEGISNEGITAAQLKQWRDAIEPIPRNIVKGSCEEFKKRLDTIGAETPAGRHAQPVSGGVTDKDGTFKHIYGNLIYYSYVELVPLDIEKVMWYTKDKDGAILAVIPIKTEFKANNISYGLFWDNPNQCPAMSAQYQRFLDAVAVHEAKHRMDIESVIKKWQELWKHHIIGVGKTQDQAAQSARHNYEFYVSNPFGRQYEKGTFRADEVRLNERIAYEIAQKENAYHNTLAKEGKAKFYWKCDVCGIIADIAPEPTPTTPIEPPTQPPTTPPPTEPRCPDGQILVDGECQEPPPTEPRCPDGQVIEDGECIDPTEPSCPDGQVLVDGECQEPPPTEPPDEEPPDEEPPDEEPPEDGGGGDDGDNGNGGDDGDDGDVSIEN